MIGECLERGVASSGSSGSADDGLRPVGCACEIAEVLERMEDGRMNILTRGTRPFRIVERAGRPRPTRRATVEFLDDKRRGGRRRRRPRPPTRPTPSSSSRRPTARPSPSELAAMTAYEMAATVDFGLDAKQGLLDLRSENARLRLVARLFRAAHQAAGLHRARAGAGALEREGPLRLRKPAAAAPARRATTRRG